MISLPGITFAAVFSGKRMLKISQYLLFIIKSYTKYRTSPVLHYLQGLSFHVIIG